MGATKSILAVDGHVFERELCLQECKKVRYDQSSWKDDRRRDFFELLAQDSVMSSVKQATPEVSIHELIAKRWSPYAFSDRSVAESDLRAIFEAARWAPSSYNEQPWRYIVATRDDIAEFEKVLSCLNEGNREWAIAAPVLAIGCFHSRFQRNGKPNVAAPHDLGLASATLTFEATHRGLSVHQMIGILPDQARAVFKIPDDVQPMTALAIGYVAPPEALPELLEERDQSARSRRLVAEFVFTGIWDSPARFV